MTDSQKQEDEEEDDDDDEDYDADEKKTKKSKAGASANNQIDTSYYDYLINMSLRNLTRERREEILKEQKEKHEKLDALQKKSPEDLYEDDLLNFETEYEKVTVLLNHFIILIFEIIQALQKEREDEMADVAHPTTKKAGGADKNKRRQTTKPQRAETKPAPHGQRITPVIDPALVKKVNEEILKRSKV